MSDETKAARAKVILVVDDDEDIRVELTEALRDEGFDATSASNGHEALVEMTRRRPDLVLLDMEMPVVPGQDVLRAMSKDAHLSSVPVFVITAGRLRPTTNVPVFHKPLRFESLMRAVHAILDP